MISQSGYVFAMGDNSKCQLGLHPEVKMSATPQQVQGLDQALQIACGAFNSYAIINDDLFSWGDNCALGLDIEGDAGSTIEGNVWQPIMVKFGGPEDEKKIKSVSGGNQHAAAITDENEMYVWGANSQGQLALTDRADRKLPCTSEDFAQLQVTQVSCGKDYTFVITENNEMLVAGRLPFMIEQQEMNKSIQTDFVTTFQSVAQFEKGVKVIQIETSKFASILVQPGNSLEPNELFMWGETPLGLFQEPTSLNQLVSECQDSSTQVFDVKAVKNGLHFSIFVDQTTGLTYQLGAEDLGDPLFSDSQVTLSELRDAKFNSYQQFACGNNFIIGQSLTNEEIKVSPAKIPGESPLKSAKKFKDDLSCGLQCITEEQNVSMLSSTSKKIKLVKIEADQLVSAEPSESLSTVCNIQTPSQFPGKAAKDVQNSEPFQMTSGEKMMTGDRTWDTHMGLTGEIFKEYLKPSEGPSEVSDEKTVKTVAKVPALNFADKALKAESNKKGNEVKHSSRELSFNSLSPAKRSNSKTKPPVAYKRDASADEEKMVTARESHSIGSNNNNVKVTPRNRPTMSAALQSSNQSLTQFKTAEGEFKKQGCDHEVRTVDYSPGVSPIDERQMTEKDSIADLTNAMNMFQNKQEEFSIFDTQARSKKKSEIEASSFYNQTNQEAIHHPFAVRQIPSESNYTSSHGPKIDLQMQYISGQQRNFSGQSPVEILQQQKTPLSHRYLPMQHSNSKMISQLASGNSQQQMSQQQLVYMHANSTGQKAQASMLSARNAIQPTNLSTVFQSFDGNQNVRASYCGPYGQPNLDQSIHYLELEGMLVKEKVEMLEQSLREEKLKTTKQDQQHKQDLEQSRIQVQDLMKQLEKAGKDYAKLLGQVDEDQEETAQMREQVRSQSNQIAMLNEKRRDSDNQYQTLVHAKDKLEVEIKETLLALRQAEEVAKVALKTQTMAQKHCQNEQCEQKVTELEEQILKKTMMVQELAKKLGSAEFENKEQKSQLEDLQGKFEEFKFVARSESNAEFDKLEQLQTIVDELKAENEYLKKEAQKVIIVQEPKVIRKPADSIPQPIFTKIDSNKNAGKNMKVAQKNPRTQSNANLMCDDLELLEFKEIEQQQRLAKRNNYVHEASQSHFTQFTSIQDGNSEADPMRESNKNPLYFDKNIFNHNQKTDQIERNVSPKPSDGNLGASQKMFEHTWNETGNEPRKFVSHLQSPSAEKTKEARERSTSRLKQPTPIAKSPLLQAKLDQIDKSASTVRNTTPRCPYAGRVATENRVAYDGLNKNRSAAQLPSQEPTQGVSQRISQELKEVHIPKKLSSGYGIQKTTSQSTLHVSMESQKRTKTPNQTFTASRNSMGQVKATPRTVTPKITPSIQANAEISATSRTGVLGAPMNLASRFGSKSTRANVSPINGKNPVSTRQKSPWDNSASSLSQNRVTYDSKRNNLLSKYKSGTTNDAKENSGFDHGRNESETQIDLQLAASISHREVNKQMNLQFEQQDFITQQMQQFKPRKSNLLSSHEEAPTNKSVLSDNTNGLVNMKDKLKSIQNNKQMLEKKIQEYERKLTMIQKKSKTKKPLRESYDESAVNSSQFTSNTSFSKITDGYDKQTMMSHRNSNSGIGQNVLPQYRQCLQSASFMK